MNDTTTTTIQPEQDQPTSKTWDMATSEYCVTWDGPGSGLILTKKIPGGRLTPIDFDGKNKLFSSTADAQAGFDIFLARTEARRNAPTPLFTEHKKRNRI